MTRSKLALAELEELAAWLEKSGGAASWLRALRNAIAALRTQQEPTDGQE